MYQAQAPGEDGQQTDPIGHLAAKITECDKRLERYKALFDAGADPDVVAEWIKTTQAERARAQAQLVPRQRRAPGQRMSRAEIEDLVGRLGEIVATLRNADPRDKAEVYHHLGLYLRFDPDPEPRPSRGPDRIKRWGYGSCRRGDLNPHALRGH